jgi:hypothetical protein
LANLSHAYADRATADPRVTPDGCADFFDRDHSLRMLDQVGEHSQGQRPELEAFLLFPEFALGCHHAKRPKRENGIRGGHHMGVIEASTGHI